MTQSGVGRFEMPNWHLKRPGRTAAWSMPNRQTVSAESVAEPSGGFSGSVFAFRHETSPLAPLPYGIRSRFAFKMGHVTEPPWHYRKKTWKCFSCGKKPAPCNESDARWVIFIPEHVVDNWF